MRRRLGAFAAAVVAGSAFAVAAPVAQPAQAATFACPASDVDHRDLAADEKYQVFSTTLTGSYLIIGWPEPSFRDRYYRGNFVYYQGRHVSYDPVGGPIEWWDVVETHYNATWRVRYTTGGQQQQFTANNVTDWGTV